MRGNVLDMAVGAIIGAASADHQAICRGRFDAAKEAGGAARASESGAARGCISTSRTGQGWSGEAERK